MFIYRLLTIVVVFPGLLCVHPLHKLVRNYQTIHKAEVHHSWKRLAPLLESVRVIRLLLWKQVIELHVSPNHDLFHPMAVATEIDESGKAQQHPINAHQFYVGQISNDARSHVKLHVAADGILTASITTENDVIYIEPASQYLNDDENMFVYNRSRIIPREIEREHFCGLKDDHVMMETFDSELRRRQAVATPSTTNTNINGRICLMHLVSDYHFFTTWGRNRISSTIINLANLVETADNIYRNTVWEPGLTNFGLQVGNITIYTAPGCVTYNQPTSPKGDRWTPQILLQEFSYNDWRAYCLAHLFTNQIFEGDALGLAYVASSNPSHQGGICSSYRRQLPGGDPSRPGTANVGMSSFSELQGRQLLQPEAEYIFTHEVGHNWGSQHDIDTPECNPPFGRNGGKYIMYASVVSGNEPNNKKFSNCSKRSIARVLQSRSTCFKQRSQSLCGNHRVEPGEECDEGLENFGGCFTGEPDSCCRDNCTFKPGAVCSDRNQPCCRGCQAAPANSTKCYVENDIDCLESVYCNGVNFSCPLAVDAKPIGSDCIDNGRCLLDETGNITCQTYCQHMYNMEPCICPSDSQQCYYCCLNNSDGVCDVVLPQLQLPNGKPCRGGICVDVCATMGECILRNADLSTRLYAFLQSLSSDALRTLIRENIVFTIIILSLIPYTAISIVICCMDRYMERKYAPLFRQVIRFMKLKQLQQKSRESSADTTDNTTMPLLY